MGQEVQIQAAVVLLETQQEYIWPEEYPVQGEVRHIRTAREYAYGNLAGIRRILKEVTEDYICLNGAEILPNVTREQLCDLQAGKIKMILPKVYCRGSLQECYRSQHYGYDFRMMLSILKKEYPDYYRHAREEVLDKSELIQPGGLFRREELVRIWKWIFTVLGRCAQFIPRRFSEYQNYFLEYLAPYLFTIYVTYRKEKHFYDLTDAIKMEVKEYVDEISENAGKICADSRKTSPAGSASYEEIFSYISGCMEERRVEEASRFARMLPQNRSELSAIRNFFLQYERERRYYRTARLDEVKDWRQMIQVSGEMVRPDSSVAVEKTNVPCIRKGRPRLLIFKWNSVGHNVNVHAFESFGFECHTIRVSYDRGKFDEDCLEQLNCHLDANSFDLAFSLNCIGMVAEACYIHDIPYIAWCYDSPSFTGAHWYLKYPTTHVFLFDSDDAEHYKRAGIKQAYYMPLAVNLEYFEGIVTTKEDREKYRADISFVGSLYDTSLPQAMGYLTDYQKGYLNALMDNQIDVYGHSFFPEILSQKFMEWLDETEFNRLVNEEFDKEKATEDVVGPGRLQLILNKQTTNKERLLLLNLLAKHYRVKLYSYKNSEALKGLEFCGTVDYYTDMPKVFRCSRINLNATLRSIQHGIPLRCLDIMGCHGLLLTNYQKDFDDHFRDGENVLFYTDAQEALEKADFYLNHESVRAKIAEAGYETVKRYYDYPVKLREIFETAGLEHLIPERGQG